MADVVNFIYGTEAQIEALTASQDGAIYMATDYPYVYLGNGATAIKYSGLTIAVSRPTIPISSQLYMIGSAGNYAMEVYVSGDWETLVSSLALGETEFTAYRGDRGKSAYDHSQLTTGNPHAVTLADVGGTTDHAALSNIGTNTHSVIDDFIASKGAASGLATLDAGSKIPASQLPSTILLYKGVWNANTNTPTLATPTLASAGWVYIVSVAGTQFGIDFKVGDWAIFNDSGVIEKSDNSDDVVSVNGQTGVVVLNTSHVAENTNLYYTESRVSANSAVVANSAKISFPGFISLLNDYGFADNHVSWDYAYGHSQEVTGQVHGMWTKTVNDLSYTGGNVLINKKNTSQASSAYAYTAFLLPDPTSINDTGGFNFKFNNPVGVASLSKAILAVNDSNIHLYNFAIEVNGVEALLINRLGDVGIGTATPLAATHIKSAYVSYAGQLVLEDNTETALTFRTGTVLSGGLMGYIDYTVASKTLSIQNYYGSTITNTNYLLLNPLGGNVAIGKTTAATALDVDGVITATGGNSTQWNTAYTNRITSLTTTGSSGAATLVANVLNIPTYTLAGLGYTAYSLPLAANGTRGGIQIGFTATGANLPLLLSSEKAYVALTKSAIETMLTGAITSHTHALISHALNNHTASTLAQLNAIISDATLIDTSDGRLSDARVASDVYTWAKAAVKPTYTYAEVGASPLAHNQVWSTITSTPTTISGYGFTADFNSKGDARWSALATFDRPLSVLSGASVFSNITVLNGQVSAIATRDLTPSDIGLTGVVTSHSHTVNQIDVVPDGYTTISSAWNLATDENVYRSISSGSIVTLSNVINGISGIFIVNVTVATTLTLVHSGYTFYVDSNAPTNGTARRLALPIGRHILTFTAYGSSGSGSIYFNVASYKTFI